MPYSLTLSLFDFDFTLTNKHTFKDRSHEPKDNLKAGVGVVFQRNKNHIPAIVSFHDDEEYIKGYIEGILKQRLSCDGVIEYEHHNLHIYYVENSNIPIVISVLKKDNYQAHLTAVSPTGKNTQIESVLAYYESLGIARGVFTEIKLYEDTIFNLDKAPKYLTRVQVQEGGQVFSMVKTTPSDNSLPKASDIDILNAYVLMQNIQNLEFKEITSNTNKKLYKAYFIPDRISGNGLTVDETLQRLNSFQSSIFIKTQTGVDVTFSISSQNLAEHILGKAASASMNPNSFHSNSKHGEPSKPLRDNRTGNNF